MTGAASSCLLGTTASSGLSATIVGGTTSLSGFTSGNTFATNTCTPVGGTAPYTYAWTNVNDGQGTWNTGTGSTLAPAVSGTLKHGGQSTATYICTVTDNVGAVAVSNSATYTWTDIS